MLSRLHGLCSWGRGKLWPEPSLTSLQDRRQKDRNKVILESDAAKKRRRNEIEIADAVIEPGPWDAQFYDLGERGCRRILLAAIHSIPATDAGGVRSFRNV